MPLIIGATRTELTSSADAAAFTLDEAGMRARVGELLGDSASRVIDVYARANPGASPSDLYFLIASDERYCAPVMKIAERRAALGRGPVYLYYFRWETPSKAGATKRRTRSRFRSCSTTSKLPRGHAASQPSRRWRNRSAMRGSRSHAAATRTRAASTLARFRRETPRHDGVRHDERRR